MKVLTVTYPRYLDSVRIGWPRNYHFFYDGVAETGDRVVVDSKAGLILAEIQSVRGWFASDPEFPGIVAKIEKRYIPDETT